MSIITISRGSYSRGKEVAEKLAQALGYQCLSRDILLEASERYNIPEIKLVRAIHDAPSILERFTYAKEPYVAYIRAALLRQAQKDNLVYHGLAGHFLLQRDSPRPQGADHCRPGGSGAGGDEAGKYLRRGSPADFAEGRRRAPQME